MHVFTYSERPNTHALTLEPVIPKQERKSRTHRLRRLSAKKRFDFDSRFEGETRPVLFEEENKDGFMFGWSDNYVRVAVPFSPRLINTIQPVQIDSYSKDGFHFGKLDDNLIKEEQTIQEILG